MGQLDSLGESRSEYVSLCQLGKLFGASARTIGDELKQMSYRTFDGEPSHKAFLKAMVSKRYTHGPQEVHFWVWECRKTIEIPEFRGWVSVDS